MKLYKLTLLGLLGLGLSSASTHASILYDFSYTFVDSIGFGTPGDTVTGTLMGTASGPLVNISSVLSMTIDGTPVTGPLYVGSAGVSSFIDGGAVASLTDPTLNNFLFADSDPATALAIGNNWFFMVPDNQTMNPFGFSGISAIAQLGGNGWSDWDTPSITSGYDTWSLTAAPAPVPEPSTIIAGALLLLPFGASALRMLRKNRAA